MSSPPVSKKCKKKWDHCVLKVLAKFTRKYKTDKPDDIILYAIDYFTKIKQRIEDDIALKAYIDTLRFQQAAIRPSEIEVGDTIKDLRGGVRSETHDVDKLMRQRDEVTIEKSTEVTKFLTETLKQSFIFQRLDDERLKYVITAMTPLEVRKGDCIIEQGSYMDALIVIEYGAFEVLRVNPPVPEPMLIKTCGRGEYFGINSLLHRTISRTSVHALTDSLLWTIPRAKFRRILLKSALSQRRRKVAYLNHVPMFENLTEKERLSIAEQIKTLVFKEGQVIYKQDDIADGIYIIEYGSVSLNIRGTGRSQIFINRVGKHQFFGEMSMITYNLRPLTAIAMKHVCVHFIAVEVFENVAGSCIQVIARTPFNLKERVMAIFGNIVNMRNLRGGLPISLRFSLESLREVQITDITFDYM